MRYSFDDFELDAARLQLLRAGEPVAAEPRVLELLVYLLRHRDRLVTKDELVAELWEGRAVTDAALSRCVYQARKALGSSSGDQRYVATVHGRGLRFDETVEVAEQAPPASPAERSAVDGEPQATLDPPEATGSAGAEDPTGRPLQPTPRASQAAARGPWILAIAVAAGLVGTFAMLVPWREHRAPEVAAPNPTTAPETSATLALLPLTIAADAGDAARERELSLLALSLTDLLHTRLAGIPLLEVRPLLTALRTAQQVDSLREAAIRVGATHLLTGSISTEGERVLAELTLFEIRPHSPTRSTPLGRFTLPALREAADFAALIQIRDAIAQRAARLVGSPYVLTLPEPGGTTDAEAWRLYVVAYQRLSDDYCGGSAPAIALLERALELDPEFGLAWEAVGTAYYNRVWACGESTALHRKAFEALDRAEQVAPTLRTPRLTRITLLIESGRVEEAYERILEELETFPDDARSLNAQSYALRYAGFLDPAARALDRVLELDPLAFVVGTLGGSPNAYLYQGRYQRFLEVIPSSEMAYHRWYRGFAELMLGEREAAQETLQPAFRSSPGEVFGRLAHGLLAVIEGDPQAARSIVRQVARQRDELGAVDAEITLKQAQILALAEAGDEALVELRKTVDQGFFCLRCLATDPSLEGLHQLPEWRDVAGAARRRHLDFARRFELSPEIE